MVEATRSDPVPTRSGAREEAAPSRLFFVGMALFLTAIVFIGFWPTYFGSVFLGQEPAEFGVVDISWPIHLHAVVFLGWMALLLTQAALVARGRTRLHTTIGPYGAVFGIVVLLVGLLIVFVQVRIAVREDMFTWAQAPLVVWPSEIELLQFAVLLGLGYVYRTRPEAHKRYMLFATMALVQAANNRMVYLLGDWSTEIMLVVMAGPVFAYDLYAERRIHPATWAGTGVLLLFFVAEALFK